MGILRKAFIPFVLLISSLTVLLIIYFDFIGHKHKFLNYFFIFMIIERVWENFFTCKDQKKMILGSDFTLPLVVSGYSFLVFVTLFDYYSSTGDNINPQITYAGIFLFFLALFIRLWGVRTLSKQWSIHAIGVSRVPLEDRYLVFEGPYKFIRHPIYTGIFIEILSIPIIVNSLWGVILAVFMLMPLYFWRASLEEKSLIRVFGWGYRNYVKKTSAFVPLKGRFQVNKNERRKCQLALSQEEMRISDRRKIIDRRALV